MSQGKKDVLLFCMAHLSGKMPDNSLRQPIIFALDLFLKISPFMSVTTTKMKVQGPWLHLRHWIY